tara:strand:- start:1284 stop:1634 length:351 start_codon:yes stop_codon:yes gene_type:complete
MKNKLNYYIILLILIIICTTFYIIKHKEIKIDNWNIIKIINNNEIENFEIHKPLCNEVKNIDLTNISDIDQKNRIIDAICNKKKSKKGDEIRKKVYIKMQLAQKNLNKKLKEGKQL